MRISRFQCKAVLIAVVLTMLICAATAIVYAKYKGNEPLSIAFSSPFPLSATSQIETCHAKVTWTNIDIVRSYDGSFLFTVEGKKFKIISADVTFTFKGAIVNPETSGNSLLFYLPQQTFLAGKSGTISVDVVYNKPGIYNWEIGIAQR
jgi:hypothetical protein